MKRNNSEFLLPLSTAMLRSVGSSQVGSTAVKTSNETGARLTGLVVAADHPGRTMIVRELSTGKQINVTVPENRRIKLSDLISIRGLPKIIDFDCVRTGMLIDLYVLPSDSLRIADEKNGKASQPLTEPVVPAPARPLALSRELA